MTSDFELDDFDDQPPFSDLSGRRTTAGGDGRLVSRSSSIKVVPSAGRSSSPNRVRKVHSILKRKPSLLHESLNAKPRAFDPPTTTTTTSVIPLSESHQPLPPLASLASLAPPPPEESASSPATTPFRTDFAQIPSPTLDSVVSPRYHASGRRSRSFSGSSSLAARFETERRNESIELRRFTSDHPSSSVTSSSPGTIFSQRSATSRTLSTASSTSSTSVTSKLFHVPPTRPRRFQPLSFDEQRGVLPRLASSDRTQPVLPPLPPVRPTNHRRRRSTTSSVDFGPPRLGLAVDRASLDSESPRRDRTPSRPSTSDGAARRQASHTPSALPSLPSFYSAVPVNTRHTDLPTTPRVRKRASTRILNAIFAGAPSAVAEPEQTQSLPSLSIDVSNGRWDKYGSLNSLRSTASPPQLSPIIATVTPTATPPSRQPRPAIFSPDLTSPPVDPTTGYSFPDVRLESAPPSYAVPILTASPVPPSPTSSSGKRKNRKRAQTASREMGEGGKTKESFFGSFLHLKRSTPSLSSARSGASSRGATPPPTPTAPSVPPLPIPPFTTFDVARPSIDAGPLAVAESPRQAGGLYNLRQNWSNDGSSEYSSSFLQSTTSSPKRLSLLDNPVPRSPSSSHLPASPARSASSHRPSLPPTASSKVSSKSLELTRSDDLNLASDLDFGGHIATFEHLRRCLPAPAQRGLDLDEDERPMPLRPPPRRPAHLGSRPPNLDRRVRARSPSSRLPGPPANSDLVASTSNSHQLPVSIGRQAGGLISPVISTFSTPTLPDTKLQ